MNSTTANKNSQTISIGQMLKSNIHDYAMYIVLVFMFILFHVLSFVVKGQWLFLSARNLTDLINQTGYVAVLAIGMTCVLIIKQIDLSVGYVMGFTGAVAALLLTNNWPVAVVIPLVLIIGICVGAFYGVLVSIVRVPAFVSTLAGQFMFRGLLLLVTGKTGTIIIRNKFFLALGNKYIPSFTISLFGKDVKAVTLILGIIAALLVVYMQVRSRNNLKKYGFNRISGGAFVIKLVLFCAVLVGACWMLASWNGLPWSSVIVMVVLLIYNFILTKTPLGRSVYAIGGNTEAAELSGINVRKVTFLTFCSMGLMASLSGIMYASRMASATPDAGNGFEMYAIASSYIGGVAVSGGVGKVTNTIVGALVFMSLTNGMTLLGTDISLQYIFKAVIFILAVAFDVISRRK